ncbi:2Fe-2S iron-sulfur cluster-binding protein [Ferrimonas lipolytica]|uniref:2Fe-2S iron-sulfur cluster binding domain-containing protein n=1 Tax=Ferrimonas lipolytica TaxID=2724191 RepID=A0A6H1UDB6_9GAMM|nr:2Fe-2S iron-sulfur cluster-binding protein [Ferrimonas lipolytica]QIZ76619.1 2Fe-2S iron-sulfur cluster binding domain-containing protein [Ferrimonas lipolytica]
MIHQVTLPNGDLAEHKEGEPLLALLKENGLYSECQNGFCGACKTKVKCGSVRYLFEPMARIQADEVLPCCCTPTSNIEVEY